MSQGRPSLLMQIEHFVEGIAALLTAASAVLIFVGIVLRNVFSTSPSWVVEAPIYTFVWAMFLVLGVTFRRGLHLGLDLIVESFPVRLKRAFAIFSAISMAIIAALLMWLGARLTFDQFNLGSVSNTALKMPLFIVTAAMPIGFGMLVLRAIADVLLRKDRRGVDVGPPDEAA
jgi:C4-dicarboxylate transporter DctQ subunit